MRAKDLFWMTSTRPIDPEFYNRPLWASRQFRTITGMLVILVLTLLALLLRRGSIIPLALDLVLALAALVPVLIWARVIIEHGRFEGPSDQHRADGPIRALWSIIWLAFAFYFAVMLAFPLPRK